MRRLYRPAPFHIEAIALVLAVAALAIASSCSRAEEKAYPKPEGWPRIEMPAADYRVCDLGGVELLVNSAAKVETRDSKEGSVWADVSYPGIKEGKIYLSITDTGGAEALAEAVDNRHERMELNSGGALTELTQLRSEGGWTCEIVLTRGSLTTPVQILAHDGERRLVSGALYLNLPPGTSPDSIAPVVKAVNRDLTEAMKHLRSR